MNGKRTFIGYTDRIYYTEEMSLEEIKTLFQKSNCLLTDFLKEDLLLCYFAENNYFIDVKQRGALFRYLLNYLYDYDLELMLKKLSSYS